MLLHVYPATVATTVLQMESAEHVTRQSQGRGARCVAGIPVLRVEQHTVGASEGPLRAGLQPQLWKEAGRWSRTLETATHTTTLDKSLVPS